ncbi:RNA polymerase sigma factor [Domibacillus robiginosus]|uniref:RNA polymerase sigma factor n=1 Tax=Domibacillus robiginosus TaxID=1071054 RepID=UPI00067AE029|nr:sigma-70 family RNA polymerase sigma factor [Domibacillus robiginosus]
MDIAKEVTKAKRGDREAFVRLVKHIESSLHNTARSIVKKEEDVADALQETILKAFKSLDSLREPTFFKTWIFRILINECRSILAKRSRIVPVSDIPAASSVSKDYENVELRELVDGLDEQQRIVVVLYYFEDMPLRQVAETLNVSESAIKMRLNRARNALMGKMKLVQEGKMDYGSL